MMKVKNAKTNGTMAKTRQKLPIDKWQGHEILAGEARDLSLAVSESYSGMDVKIPIHIQRAVDDGPVVFITGALHGDELNGTGAIRHLLQDEEFRILKGALIFAPVLNILGFDRHSRYLPDRRDLNRAFPGLAAGSLAGRMGRTIFEEIVARADVGIDLHTASKRRTNYPNARGDLADPMVRRLAESFGCEILMNGRGPRGALRREATKSGCPTIVVEGGEVSKVEPGIVEAFVRGIKNVLCNLEMLEGPEESPDYQIVIEKSKWVRAERGGFLQFHIKPGDIVEKGQPIATNTTLLGREGHLICAPFNAVVIGMTTLPATSPGEPICNLGKLSKSTGPKEFRRLRHEDEGLEERVLEELASNVMITEPSEDPADVI